MFFFGEGEEFCSYTITIKNDKVGLRVGIGMVNWENQLLQRMYIHTVIQFTFRFVHATSLLQWNNICSHHF